MLILKICPNPNDFDDENVSLKQLHIAIEQCPQFARLLTRIKLKLKKNIQTASLKNKSIT